MINRDTPPTGPRAGAGGLDPTAIGQAMADRLIERGVYLPLVLRVTDMASFLDLTERAIRQQIAQGRIPAVKPGRDWLIPRDKWLRGLEDEAEDVRPARRRR